MKFNEEVNCESCRHGYFVDYSHDGWHMLCGKFRCYLCAKKQRECDDYEEGSPPEDKDDLV